MTKNTPLSRRTFLAGTTLAATAAWSRTTHASPPNHPDIVFVFSDEHRYQSMSFTEMPEVHTPNMTRMAREGFSFSQCVSNYPVCSPYRGMLMTGRYPWQNGVIDNGIALEPDGNALGDAFRAAGYATAYIGKWHLGGVRAEPFGFDLSLIWTDTNDHYDTSVYHPADGPPARPRGYNATLMTDQALDYIATADERPYLLLVSLNPPHSKFTDAPPAMRALYPDGSLPTRPNYHHNTEGDHIAHKNGTPHYEGYHAHVSAIDEELGRILDAVDASGRDTIVVYTSDHGTQFGSHGIGSKRQPYEESLRVPMLIHAPGRIAAGSGSTALIGAPDMMPTLCGLAGVPVPSPCAGADFSGHALFGRGPEPEAQLIMHIAKDNASGGTAHPAPLFRGVRTRRYTYAVDETGVTHFFNNRNDPYQMTNLAEDPALAGIRRELHDHLRSLLRMAEDPFRLS